MERVTIEKCGELLIKYNDGEYRSPCFGCESISKCNPSEKTCGFYKALERLKEYEDIGLTPGQLLEVDKLYAEKCKELAEFQKNNLSGLELALIWAKLEKLKEYQKLEEQGKLLKLTGAEKYSIEQVLDAIVQADDNIVVALAYKDREMLEDVLKDFLNKGSEGNGKGTTNIV